MTHHSGFRVPVTLNPTVSQLEVRFSESLRGGRFLSSAPATTRNWNTILAVVRILKPEQNKPAESQSLTASAHNPFDTQPVTTGTISAGFR
jgi:hypothetical protein